MEFPKCRLARADQTVLLYWCQDFVVPEAGLRGCTILVKGSGDEVKSCNIRAAWDYDHSLSQIN